LCIVNRPLGIDAIFLARRAGHAELPDMVAHPRIGCIGKVMSQRFFAFPFFKHIDAGRIIAIRAPIIMNAPILRQRGINMRFG